MPSSPVSSPTSQARRTAAVGPQPGKNPSPATSIRAQFAGTQDLIAAAWRAFEGDVEFAATREAFFSKDTAAAHLTFNSRVAAHVASTFHCARLLYGWEAEESSRKGTCRSSEGDEYGSFSLLPTSFASEQGGASSPSSSPKRTASSSSASSMSPTRTKGVPAIVKKESSSTLHLRIDDSAYNSAPSVKSKAEANDAARPRNTAAPPPLLFNYDWAGQEMLFRYGFAHFRRRICRAPVPERILKQVEAEFDRCAKYWQSREGAELLHSTATTAKSGGKKTSSTKASSSSGEKADEESPSVVEFIGKLRQVIRTIMAAHKVLEQAG
ncbi:unnamed protein product [Amoebophrya sp. A25]|nr:unnamed protein product [Amoebophrya sp. A25]|eukprot:GSA25T00016952001.1